MAENVTGKKMSDYPNVNDTSKVSAAQKEAFMADAVVVGVGSKPSGQTGKVNYGIPLSEIGGGGGGSDIPELPPDAADRDYVLGIKNGKLDWVELQTTVSSITHYVVYQPS